jgi:hypothetical protein
MHNWAEDSVLVCESLLSPFSVPGIRHHQEAHAMGVAGSRERIIFYVTMSYEIFGTYLF